MKKVELLSPVGDVKSFYSAISNGADAVYLSGKNYGARKFASNFTLEEIKDAISTAHLYGVKVYVTVNTLMFESELNDVLDYIYKLYSYGVDALIMQDVGLMKKCLELYPNLEIHVSTQAHNHNNEQLEYLKKLGVKRVVLARELTIDEIAKMNTSIEKEVFIHGALCVSYSGECLLSSCKLNRSGNRGECAGLCRLSYKMYENGKLLNKDNDYILSMKELNTTEDFIKILESGVDSLKIEGRMKSYEYVGYVTKIYRKLIDAYYENKKITLSEEEKDNLAILYNREFTKGFINNEKKYNIVNSKSPNHQGLVIGRVIDFNLKKIKILLDKELVQGDGIRLPNNEGMIANYIYNEKDLLINKAIKGQIIYLNNKVDLKEKGNVLKTSSILLTNCISDKITKKVPIKFILNANVNENLELIVSDGKNKISLKGDVLEKALNKKTTKEECLEKLAKLGDSPFYLQDSIININDAFVPMSKLNELRRNIVSLLIQKRMEVNSNLIVNKEEIKNYSFDSNDEVSFLVRNEEQLKYLLDKNVIIYTDDYLLYKKYKNANVYFRMSRVINTLPNLENENICITNLGALDKYQDINNLVSDIYLNVTNSLSARLLASKNIKKIGLSPEISDDELINLINNFPYNYEILVYGRREVMLMKYCPINYLKTKGDKCFACHGNKYELVMDGKDCYPFITKNCLGTMLDNENINLLEKIGFYRKMGISNFRIDLYDESISEIQKIWEKL